MDGLNGPKIDSPQPALDLNCRGKFQRMLPSLVGKCEDQNKIQVLIPLPGHYGIGLLDLQQYTGDFSQAAIGVV